MKARLGLAVLVAAALGGCGSHPNAVTGPFAGPTPHERALQVSHPAGMTPLAPRAASAPLFDRRPDGGLPWGLTDNAIDDHVASPTLVASAMHAAGADMVRLVLLWPAVEPSPGAQDWRRSDAEYRAFAAQGIRVVWMLFYTPRWAVASGDQQSCGGPYCLNAEPSEAHLPDLGAFAARVAQRYPLSAGIEYRNESNLPGADGKPRVAPDVYVRGLRAVDLAVRKAGSGVRVLGGALANVPGWDGYASDMLKAGAARWMDALTFHPYVGHSGVADFRALFATLQHVIGAHGANSLRVFPDEFGASTTPTRDGLPVYDQAGQARQLLAEFSALDHPPAGWPLADRVDAALLFTTIEKPVASQIVGYGWLRPQDGRFLPKTVFCSFRRRAGHLTAPFAGLGSIAACP